MTNSLLDFVMSLVRDPAAAARYAADPAAAIADAHLTGVTSADVDNLIPMVTDSLSIDSTHLGTGIVAVDGNVWTSGAATAAIDAFGSDVPEFGRRADEPAQASEVSHHPLHETTHEMAPVLVDPLFDPPADLSVDDVPDWAADDAWDDHTHLGSAPDAHPGLDLPGIDPDLGAP